MRFIPPANVIKLTKAQAEQVPLSKLIWPLGTLFQVKDTTVYFRFLNLGGRWNTEFGISTDSGMLCRAIGTTDRRIADKYDECERFPTKQDAVEALLKLMSPDTVAN